MAESDILELTETLSEHLNSYRDTPTLLKTFRASENNLINLSAELLAILTTLSQQQKTRNLPELHQYILKCVSQLHNRGLQADYPPRLMEKACYVLCAAFDEEIMNTQWGQEACWENHSLVAQLFKQRNAGEVFFILMEQARQNIAKMLDFIELLYLLLRLGFKGRYQNTDGHALAELTNHLYDDIHQYRKQPDFHHFSPPCQPWLPLQQFRIFRYLPIILVFLVIAAFATRFWIHHINALNSDDLNLLVYHFQLFSEPPDSRLIL